MYGWVGVHACVFVCVHGCMCVYVLCECVCVSVSVCVSVVVVAVTLLSVCEYSHVFWLMFLFAKLYATFANFEIGESMCVGVGVGVGVGGWGWVGGWVGVGVCVCVCVSLASSSSETIKVIIIKCGTVTTSDMIMHHVLIIPSFKSHRCY